MPHEWEKYSVHILMPAQIRCQYIPKASDKPPDRLKNKIIVEIPSTNGHDRKLLSVKEIKQERVEAIYGV